ncbi:MAG: hypothetical protein IJ272_05465 [Clostridia bacterium]|nr:hypothetical protein [Clostridia bacterium]
MKINILGDASYTKKLTSILQRNGHETEATIEEAEMILVSVAGSELKNTIQQMDSNQKGLIVVTTTATDVAFRNELMQLTKAQLPNADICIMSSIDEYVTLCDIKADNADIEDVVKSIFERYSFKIHTSKDEKKKRTTNSIKLCLAIVLLILFMINTERTFLLTAGDWEDENTGNITLNFNYWGSYDRYHDSGSPIGNSDVFSAYFMIGNVLVMIEPGSTEVYRVDELNAGELILINVRGEESNYRR